ncbi:MAG: hypothetical protein GQ533_08845 [Methanosarcinaceae archaeon]|nr:hypothetical protein [Methanosarcinaceae archaeon]
MSDLPLEKKKESDKEPSEDTPSFDTKSQVVNVHKVDDKKPPAVSVIDALSEDMNNEINSEINDVDDSIPSSDDVSGLDKVNNEKTDLQKSSSHPLFEPTLPADEDTVVDDVSDKSYTFSKMPTPFEVYGQEPIEMDYINDEAETIDEEIIEQESESLTPFPPTSEPDVSPFPPTLESEPHFPPSTPDVQPPSQPFATSSSLDVVAKKTMDGIMTSFRDVLKKLTRGGSLIDRMEELREEVEIAEEERLKEESEKRTTPEISPFEEVPEIIRPEPQPQGMEQPTPVPKQKIEKVEVKEPEPERVVVEPIGELHKDEMRELVGGLSKDEIQALVGEQIKEAFEDHEEPVTPVESMVSDTDVDDLKNEVESSKALIDEIANNIKELSSTVENSTVSMNEIKKSTEDFDSDVSLGFDSAREKIGGIEERLDVVENTLTLIQSENADTKAGLSNIGQNISELVGSYSALLSQMQESAQSNDIRFEELSNKVGRIDAVDSRISHIENNQVIATETITELRNTASILMSDIAESYEANETLKGETKSDNTALREEMALVTEYVEKGLKKVGAGSYRSFGQDVQLVHLEKNSSTMKLCMEWIEFLMELVGRNNLPDILSYYEELGWISDDVRLEVMRYAEGIDYYVEKPDWKLNPDEHVKSIWFIEKLAGVKVDKNRLSIIERDIERVKKGTEIYGI